MKLSEVVAGLAPTDKIYLRDSYINRTVSRVERVVKEKGKVFYVVLDSTIFHPLGGGQPSDRGLLLSEGMTFEVRKALEHEGIVALYGRLVDGELVEGMNVTQELDWGFRYYVMRLHTAGHVIDRAVSDLLGGRVKTLSANHGPPKAYVEYEAEICEGMLEEIERRANELLGERRVLIYEVPREELRNRVYGAPNLGRLPEAETYRIVEIEGINAIPCSGTHVRSTTEVGNIVISGAEKLEGGTRLFYDVVSGEGRLESMPTVP